MTLTLELKPEIEQGLLTQAQERGVSLDAYLQYVLSRLASVNAPDDSAPSATSLQDDLTPEEWVRQFHEWAESHDRTTPLLSDEAISRDSIYPDRL